MHCFLVLVEWSEDPEFPVNGTSEMDILELKKMETIVNGLSVLKKLYFRVSVGNCKGFSQARITTPFSVIPSCKKFLNIVHNGT